MRQKLRGTHRTLGSGRGFLLSVAAFIALALISLRPGQFSHSPVGNLLHKYNPFRAARVSVTYRPFYAALSEDGGPWIVQEGDGAQSRMFDALNAGSEHEFRLVSWMQGTYQTGWWAPTLASEREPVLVTISDHSSSSRERADMATLRAIHDAAPGERSPWLSASLEELDVYIDRGGPERRVLWSGWALNAASLLSFVLFVWSCFAFSFTIPARWRKLTSRRRARLRRGLCPSCGYDISGIDDRCPECGEGLGVR
ncbi:MAG: hypothetical protein AAFR38_05245 [Planctomycetota bacterium]